VPGEVCVNCDFFGGAIPLICTPDPHLDPDGYQVRIEEEGFGQRVERRLLVVGPSTRGCDLVEATKERREARARTRQKGARAVVALLRRSSQERLRGLHGLSL
jgi:hypothetical protein